MRRPTRRWPSACARASPPRRLSLLLRKCAEAMFGLAYNARPRAGWSPACPRKAQARTPAFAACRLADKFSGNYSGAIDCFTHEPGVGEQVPHDLWADDLPVERAGYYMQILADETAAYLRRLDRAHDGTQAQLAACGCADRLVFGCSKPAASSLSLYRACSPCA